MSVAIPNFAPLAFWAIDEAFGGVVAYESGVEGFAVLGGLGQDLGEHLIDAVYEFL